MELQNLPQDELCPDAIFYIYSAFVPGIGRWPHIDIKESYSDTPDSYTILIEPKLLVRDFISR